MSETDTPGLKACPFCGAAPYPDVQNDDCPLPGDYGKDGGRYYQVVWCEKCGAEAGKRKAAAEAIVAWNRRAPDDRDATIARLREALAPFAAVAMHDVGDSEHDNDLYIGNGGKHNRAPALKVHHFRAALAALETGK